jgi:cytoskeletal protein RodZ
MNGTPGSGSSRGFLKGFSVVLLTGAFVASSGMPLLASPQQPSDSNTSAPQQQPAEPQQTAQAQPDPQQPTSSLPDAPQAQTQTPAAQQPTQTPSGTAGAKAATVKGAPVAQPTGAAIAPARQRGHHSLLLKVGLLAGAGIAVGAAVALAEASPSRPPGAR